jgi:carbonic anhydrase
MRTLDEKGFMRMESKSTFGNVLLAVTLLAGIALVGFLITGQPTGPPVSTPTMSPKPNAAEILQALKAGNERFVSGNLSRRNVDTGRIALAGKESQEKHAYATVISCSDSRVPVELIFDAGIMELFVVRVAGNVCDTDEAGSIEYGLAHVHTPVLVVLGHTQCGAVTEVVHAVRGTGHPLERNIPPLVDNILPAVHRAIERHPNAHGDAVVPFAIEENVWQAIEDLFMRSPAVRALAASGNVQVVGAVYDLATGKVDWLDPDKTAEILQRVEASPIRETQAFAAK